MCKTVLIVEDEALVGLAMQETLRRHGYHIPEVIDSGDEVFSAIAAHRPDLILMDIRINSFIDGVDVAARMKMVNPIPVVFITAHNDPATRGRAAKTSPSAYLIKPVEEHTLLNTVRAVLS